MCAEITLFLLDAGMTGIIVLFLTAISTWEYPVLDGALLMFWAAIPSSCARFLRARPWPSSPVAGLFLCVLLMSLALFSGIAGWEFIADRIDLNIPMAREVTVILLTCWSSGFFLFQIQTYRLHDALSLGALVIGLVDGRPQGLFWCGLHLFLFFLAAPLRHQLFDIHAYRSEPDIDLRRQRRTWLAIILSALILLPLVTWLAGRLFQTRDTPWQFSFADTAPEVIDWSDSFKLSELGRARESTAPLFALHIYSGGEELLPPRVPVEDKNTLWRMQAMDRPLGDGSRWTTSPAAFVASSRPDRMRISPRPFVAPDLTFRFKRLSSFSPLLPHRYDGVVVELLETTAEDAALGRNSRGELSVFRNKAADARTGDIIQLKAESRRARALGIRTTESPTGDMYLDVPADSELGLDLTDLADRIFAGANSLEDKLNRLAAFFRRSFAYDTEVAWSPRRRRQESKLGHFLMTSHVGDCTYFAASSILLLRRAGVRARLAKGFLGHSWSALRKSFVIYGGSAHAWAEYYDEKMGWRPFDATGLVPDRRAPKDPDMPPLPEDDAPASTRAGPSRGLLARSRNDFLQDRQRLTLVIVGACAAALLLFFLRRPRLAPRRQRRQAVEEPPVNRATHPADLPFSAMATGTSSNRTLVLKTYAAWQDVLTRRHLGRGLPETPTEHALRLSRQMPASREGLVFVAELFNRTLFGMESVSEADAEAFRKTLRDLRRQLR